MIQNNVNRLLGDEDRSVGSRTTGRRSGSARTTIVASALAASLAVAGATGAVGEGARPERASAGVRVTASVVPQVRFRLLHQAGTLVVTESDVAQGYVDVPYASLLEVRTNSARSFLLVFEVGDGPATPVDHVRIRGLASEVQIGTGASLVPQPSARGIRRVALGYRFILRKDAPPGRYAWPVVVTAMPE